MSNQTPKTFSPDEVKSLLTLAIQVLGNLPDSTPKTDVLAVLNWMLATEWFISLLANLLTAAGL